MGYQIDLSSGTNVAGSVVQLSFPRGSFTFAKTSHNRVILSIFNLAETTSSIKLPINLPKLLGQSPKSVFEEVSKWIHQDKMSLQQNGEAKWSLSQGPFPSRFVCSAPPPKNKREKYFAPRKLFLPTYWVTF